MNHLEYYIIFFLFFGGIQFLLIAIYLGKSDFIRLDILKEVFIIRSKL